MNVEFWSQVGFGIVATAFGWWAWQMWLTLKEERIAHALALKEERQAHNQQVIELTDKLINWADVVRTALLQNTDALKGLKDGFGLYERLDELQRSVNGTSQSGR